MKTSVLTCMCLALGILLSGCGKEKKITPVAVGEMTEYRDQMFGFSFSYPKAWSQTGEAGHPKVLTPVESAPRFLDQLGPYPDGVMFSIEVTRTATPDQDVKKTVDEMRARNIQVEQQVAVTVGGKQATKVPYVENYSTKVRVSGYHIYIPADSLLYDLNASGFGDLYAAHAAVFEAVVNSFKLPVPVEKGRDQTLPSLNMSQQDTKLFSFAYPDNFNFTNPAKGQNELVVEIRGVRQDCSIRFDVFGAKGLTTEKVYQQQNVSKFKPTATGKASIGGEQAQWVTYSPTKDVERRFYFLVKNDKVFRVTMDWYRPQRTEYLAAYEKVIASIKFK
jgi:hypothetical protein